MTTRRAFIAVLGGAAAWPVVTRGQQVERMRRIGVLMNFAAHDPEGPARLAAFLQGLQQLGWSEGRNVRVEIRWEANNPERSRTYAAELMALVPDVVLAAATPATAALLQASRTVPIVFAVVGDPVGSGFVGSLARPGGNATGFMNFEYGLSAKWLELLKQVAPRTLRAGILRDPTVSSAIGQLGALQSIAPSLAMEVVPIDVREVGEIERVVTSSVLAPGSGMIVLPGGLMAARRELVIALAARHRLPTIYPYRYYVAGGGLMGYGPDPVEQFRRAAAYVDRILKGEKPADLPVQAPTRYELVINLKTAKALGLTLPETLLARADEVIE
jgi:putative ABC transport system substrate-binding protein